MVKPYFNSAQPLVRANYRKATREEHRSEEEAGGDTRPETEGQGICDEDVLVQKHVHRPDECRKTVSHLPEAGEMNGCALSLNTNQ